MKIRIALPIFLLALILIFSVESKTIDPYKVLGVDRSAGQREIQKAFHKLSLKYHPDKNKNKGAQEKFAEINNAYDILSDEEKRKNYDLYGDEKGNPGFDVGGGGNRGGYSYFTSGGPGQSGFNYRPGDWQNMGGQRGDSSSFSFSFDGPGSQSSFGFGLDDIFSNFFGGGSKFGGFGGHGKPSTRTKSSSKDILSVNSQIYKTEVVDKGMTWLLFSYTPVLSGIEHYESIISEVAISFRGALKVGGVNCKIDQSLCKEIGLVPRVAPRIFLYSYRSSESGSLVEYHGDVNIKSLKTFCQDHLPRFSKRVKFEQLDLSFGTVGTPPKVMLLSTKKDTPVIWRALSGLYRKRLAFYDAQVHDDSDPELRRLGVDALPAIVGWLSNGEKHVLRTGIYVKDLESAIQDLSASLENFEKKNKKSAESKNRENESAGSGIPVISGSNFQHLCGENAPVCIIGAFRSSKAREKLEKILLSVSQKSLSRRYKSAIGSKDPVVYVLLDSNKQQSFLSAFDKSGYKSSDEVLLAYKPRKGKFAVFLGELTVEEAEMFISSVLSGDAHFTKTRQKPVAK